MRCENRFRFRSRSIARAHFVPVAAIPYSSAEVHIRAESNEQLDTMLLILSDALAAYQTKVERDTVTINQSRESGVP